VADVKKTVSFPPLDVRGKKTKKLEGSTSSETQKKSRKGGRKLDEIHLIGQTESALIYLSHLENSEKLILSALKGARSGGGFVKKKVLDKGHQNLITPPAFL